MVSQAPGARPLRLIKCGLGGDSYAVDMRRVRGIERADRLRPAAGPDGLAGRLPGPGPGIPVFRLAERLGRTGAADGGQHVIVFGDPARPGALLVDRVSQVVEVSADRASPLPPPAVGPGGGFFEAVVALDEGLILALDPDRLLPGAGPGGRGDRHTGLAGVAGERPFPVFRNLLGQRRGPNRLLLFAATDPRPRERPVTFGLSLSQVLEIREPLPVVPVPGAPETVLGLASWRSLVVPVLDLARCLGLPPAAAGRSRLVIAHAGDPAELLAFPVRPSARVLPLPVAHAPCRQPPPLNPGLTRGLFELRGEILVVPDLPRVYRGASHRPAAATPPSSPHPAVVVDPG